MNTKRFAPIIVAISLSALASMSHAQYAWIDEKGVKQFSDMPPPPHITQDRILKQPGMAPRKINDAASDSTTEKAVPAPTQNNAPLTIAEKNAEFNKRRIEQAEKEKKAAEKAKYDADKAKNCERARDYSRNLNSGIRIARIDSNGERIILSDEERAQELKEAQRILREC